MMTGLIATNTFIWLGSVVGLIAGVMGAVVAVFQSRTLTKPTSGPATPDTALTELLTYPSREEGMESLAALRAMHPRMIAPLAKLGEYEIESRAGGMRIGLPLAPSQGYSFARDGLGELGLIQPTGGDDDLTWVRLTDRGRKLARLLVARGEVPEWLRESDHIPR
jgi:hypothetical protein